MEMEVGGSQNPGNLLPEREWSLRAQEPVNWVAGGGLGQLCASAESMPCGPAGARQPHTGRWLLALAVGGLRGSNEKPDSHQHWPGSGEAGLCLPPLRAGLRAAGGWGGVSQQPRAAQEKEHPHLPRWAPGAPSLFPAEVRPQDDITSAVGAPGPGSGRRR